MKKSPKVFVGMSGGVDSSVSAAILKKKGYDVTGVFIKVWQPDFMPCSWKEERREAMRVCAHLNIPFITLDLEKEYKKEVVDYMIEEYKKGRTPNPDVMCNKYVKFGSFFDYTMKKGADFVATGHYTQTRHKSTNEANDTNMFSSPPQMRRGLRGGAEVFRLLKGKDPNKDQTYFLWTLTQKQLPKTLFPVGNMEKKEVRKLAKKFKLPNAEKKDSQGLCFVGKVEMKEFLSHYLKTKPGRVLNEKGEVIGKHGGALFSTIGERHSFTVDSKTAHANRYFVIDKNIKKNTLTVATELKSKEHSSSIRINNCNWIDGLPLKNKSYQAEIRYRGKPFLVKIKTLPGKSAEIKFLDQSEPVASGQSIVIYYKNECLGGGIAA